MAIVPRQTSCFCCLGPFWSAFEFLFFFLLLHMNQKCCNVTFIVSSTSPIISALGTNSSGRSSSKALALFIIHCLAYLRRVRPPSPVFTLNTSKAGATERDRRRLKESYKPDQIRFKYEMLQVFDRVGARLQPPWRQHTHLNTQRFLMGPADWSVGVGCQPLCVCKCLGNGSWMGAGGLFVCTLQSLSLGRTGPLPLLVSLMPLCLLALPVFLSGTFSAAHAAVENPWRRNAPGTNRSSLAVHSLTLLLIVPTFACPTYAPACNLQQKVLWERFHIRVLWLSCIQVSWS